jgi:hypothetical protein
LREEKNGRIEIRKKMEGLRKEKKGIIESRKEWED